MRAGHQKAQVMIRSLEFLATKESLKMGSAIHHAYIMEPPSNPEVQGSESFHAGKCNHTERVMHANSMGTEAPALGALPDHTLHISSSGCSSGSFIIPFNNVVNMCFPEFFKRIFKPKEGIAGTSDL